MRTLEKLAEHLNKVGEDTSPYWRSLSHKHTGDDISWQEDVIRNALNVVANEIDRATYTNLCDSCQWGCMAECPHNPDIAFGTGFGNDNVITCHNYINREAYAKYTARGDE